MRTPRLLLRAELGTAPTVSNQSPFEFGPAPVQFARAAEPLHAHHRVGSVDHQLVAVAIPVGPDVTTNDRIATPEEIDEAR